MVILGIDPGFTSLGWALLDFSNARPKCLGAGVIRTKVNPTMKKCDDNKRRIAWIARQLSMLERRYSFVLIAAEAQSWTRFQKADRAVAMAWGSIATLGELWAVPILQFSPKEIKQTICNDGSASKESVQNELEANVDEAFNQLSKIRRTQRNHAADALGAAYCAIGHDLCQMLVNVKAERLRSLGIGAE